MGWERGREEGRKQAVGLRGGKVGLMTQGPKWRGPLLKSRNYKYVFI